MIAQPPANRKSKPTELEKLLRTRSYKWAYRRYRRVCFYRKVTAQLIADCDSKGKSTAAADLQGYYNRLCDIEDRMRANRPAPGPAAPGQDVALENVA